MILSVVANIPAAATRTGPAGKVVKKYKYLGIWFNSQLKWDDHFHYTRAKAKTRSASLRKLCTNNRIVARAKTLVWSTTGAKYGKSTKSSLLPSSRF